jgi:hypothetical protein
MFLKDIITYKDYIYLTSPIKLPIKINLYIYFIDILWFFIKQNKKKKFNKNIKSIVKSLKKINYFSPCPNV